MVLLTMTGAVVEALELIRTLEKAGDGETKPRWRNENDISKEQLKEERKQKTENITEHDTTLEQPSDQEKPTPKATNEIAKATATSSPLEPSLLNPKIGNPISHGQIIDIAQALKRQGKSPLRLETLLKGSRIYIPPPPPKPDTTPEYKALMARLRREQEARTYLQMTNPSPLAVPFPPLETFSQRFPTASAAYAFSANHEPPSNAEEDEVTYADIDRQMSVILNVVVSIVACAAAIWIAARWWSTPMRLALSMSGSMLVGVAEVVVYAGYIRRVGEAKGKEKKVREVKEVVNSWVVGGEDKEPKEDVSSKPLLIGEEGMREEFKARKRK